MMCSEHEMLDGVPDPDCEDCRQEARRDMEMLERLASTRTMEDKNDQ